MSTVSYPYVEVRENGEAFIVGETFRFKVRLLVEEYLATGADAAQLQSEHPHLTLSQIHSALAYYYDHREVIDQEIESLTRLMEEHRAQQGESLLAKKMRDLGRDLPKCFPSTWIIMSISLLRMDCANVVSTW